MGKGRSSTSELRCTHPVLARYAENFIKAVDAPDPVEASTRLGEMSRNWQSASQRRRALAARIALLGESNLAKDPAPAVENDDADAEATDAENVELAAPIEEEPAAAPKAPRKPVVPKLNMKDTANLFAEFDTSDETELNVADSSGSGSTWGSDSRGSSSSFGMGANDWPDANSSSGNGWNDRWPDGKDGSLFESRTSEDEDMSLTKKKDTMTDLSLAILTGSFKAKPKQEEIEVAEEVSSEGSSPAEEPAESPVEESDPPPRKPDVMPDLSAMFAEMDEDPDEGIINTDNKGESTASAAKGQNELGRVYRKPLDKDEAEIERAAPVAASVVGKDRAAQFKIGFGDDAEVLPDEPEQNT